jgi:hypothetical protein
MISAWFRCDFCFHKFTTFVVLRRGADADAAGNAGDRFGADAGAVRDGTGARPGGAGGGGGCAKLNAVYP